MEPTQTFTKDLETIDVGTISKQAYALTPQQQIFIDYKAVGGVILDRDTDNMIKLSMEALAKKLGVDRRTLYNWRDEIPGFWERVDERRKELNAGEWLSRMHATWKIKALKFDNWQITEAWLINFDKNYKTPKVKVEHDVGDALAEAMNVARQRRVQADNVQEAEVIDNASDA